MRGQLLKLSNILIINELQYLADLDPAGRLLLPADDYLYHY